MQEKNVRILSLSLMLVAGVIIGSYVFRNTAPAQEAEKQQENQNIEEKASVTPDSAWDKLWAVYTSPQGISFRYPKQIGVLDGCGDEHKASNPYVGMKVLENEKKGSISLVPEYYYDYPMTAEGEQDTSKPCQKKSILDVAEEESGYMLGGLDIMVREVKNRAEFDKFVQDVTAPGCEAEDEPSMESEYSGEYRLKYDGKSLDETSCPFNAGYKLVYNTNRNKAFFLSLGQDCNITNENPNIDRVAYVCYIPEIADSIQID